ncbi:MAG: (2Fe-2S)-binding protein [Phycisphaerales bacterium]|nr:(2Fe-2S)-binding protein [Phycisphaerales bacterium]MCC7410668.1 (2Fe-2S)-binding protein [Gammaproteobacteria bacterium]
MFVCICNAVRESDIHAAVDDGVRSFPELQQRLRVATCCGACHTQAQGCLAEAVAGSSTLAHGGRLACA